MIAVFLFLTPKARFNISYITMYVSTAAIVSLGTFMGLVAHGLTVPVNQTPSHSKPSDLEPHPHFLSKREFSREEAWRKAVILEPKSGMVQSWSQFADLETEDYYSVGLINEDRDLIATAASEIGVYLFKVPNDVQTAIFGRKSFSEVKISRFNNPDPMVRFKQSVIAVKESWAFERFIKIPLIGSSKSSQPKVAPEGLEAKIREKGLEWNNLPTELTLLDFQKRVEVAGFPIEATSLWARARATDGDKRNRENGYEVPEQQVITQAIAEFIEEITGIKPKISVLEKGPFVVDPRMSEDDQMKSKLARAGVIYRTLTEAENIDKTTLWIASRKVYDTIYRGC